MTKRYEALPKTGHSIKQQLSAASYDRLYNDENLREQLGKLLQQISFLRQKSNLCVFNFVASREREGVSSVVVTLAQLMAGKNPESRVLLIDANLQHPVLHNAFNVASSPGLRDILVDGTGTFEYIHRFGSSGCTYVIPCGTNEGLNASYALGQEKLLSLLTKLRGEYDYIFIDSPALLISSNAISLAVSSDITFLVLEAFKTQWEVAVKAKCMLEEKNCKIGGVILNRTKKIIPDWIYKKI